MLFLFTDKIRLLNMVFKDWICLRKAPFSNHTFELVAVYAEMFICIICDMYAFVYKGGYCVVDKDDSEHPIAKIRPTIFVAHIIFVNTRYMLGKTVNIRLLANN